MAVKAARAQFSGNIDRQVNVDKAVALARQAADAGAKIVTFPELATSISFCLGRDPKFFACAEPIDGPSIEQMQGVARETGMVIVFPFYEREVWDIEPRAHAIANNYYVGGVNKVSPDVGGAPDRSYFGSSVFIGPRGELLARAGDEQDEIVYADIDRALVEDTRNLWHFFRDRRPDEYGLVAESADGRELEPVGVR